MLNPDASEFAAGGKQEAISVRELGTRVMAGGFGKTFIVRGVVMGEPRVFQPEKGFGATYVYGELSDGSDGPEIAFQCPANAAPTHAGEHAVIEGQIKVRLNKRSKRYELRFTGRKVGTWGAPSQPKQVQLQRQRPRIGLQELLGAESLQRVTLIGTDTGMLDVESTTRRSGISAEFRKVRVNVTNWEEMLRVSREANATSDAICLVRGGGDARDFTCWQETAFVTGLLSLGKPFYTALGHSTSQPTLADLYADEQFATPSELGSAYAAAMRAREGAQRVLAEKREAERRLEQERIAKYKMRSMAASEQRSRGQAEGDLRIAGERERALRQHLKRLWIVAGTLVLLLFLATAVLLSR